MSMKSDTKSVTSKRKSRPSQLRNDLSSSVSKGQPEMRQPISDVMELQLEREKDVLEQLLVLEKEMREHYLFHQDEAQKQCTAIDRIWLLSQRYLIIYNPPCSQHADFYPKPTEYVILEEYNDKLRFLRASNCQIMHSINRLRESCLKFENLCSLLDMDMETPFLLGDHFHKPISFFMELVSDLFKYMHALVLKMKYTCALMEPIDLNVLEDYKKLLKPNEDFYEYLHMGLIYCHCLQKKPACPEKTERFPCLKKLP